MVVFKIRDSVPSPRYSSVCNVFNDSMIESMDTMIRWVDDDFDIHEDPIELINVPQTDAQTLTSYLHQSLFVEMSAHFPMPWSGI